MKKMIYLVAVMIACGLNGYSQDDAIARFFSEYADREDITSISLSGKVFELADEIEVDEDAEKYKKMASDIKSFRMIVDDNDGDAKNTAIRARKLVSLNFEDLVTVRDKTADIHLMIDESNGVVHELLAIVGSDSSFLIASVIGEMRLSDLGAVTKQLTAVGQNMADAKLNPSEILIFPSPAKAGQQLQIEFPEELLDARVGIYDVSGKEMLSFKANSKSKKLDSAKLGTGVFLLKAANDDLEITRKFLIQ